MGKPWSSSLNFSLCWRPPITQQPFPFWYGYINQFHYKVHAGTTLVYNRYRVEGFSGLVYRLSNLSLYCLDFSICEAFTCGCAVVCRTSHNIMGATHRRRQPTPVQPNPSPSKTGKSGLTTEFLDAAHMSSD